MPGCKITLARKRKRKGKNLKIELPHVRQKTEWDCGLACSLMVLQKLLGNKFDNAVYEEICAAKNFGTSVWTIDIASIFTDYKADYVFCTKTLGVDPSYGQNSFYERTFNFDETRVNRLFTLAPTLGLKVEKRSVSLEEIISRLLKGYVALVLVNSNALICNWCEVFSPNKLRMLTNCICPSSQSDYCGHYVVLCGFDADKRCVYYKNPSFNEDLCCAKFDMFETARHSYGTDEDIVFVKLEEPELMKETFINGNDKI